MKYVGIIYQGMAVAVEGVAMGDDEETIRTRTEGAAEEANARLTGESEGYVPAVVRVPDEA